MSAVTFNFKGGRSSVSNIKATVFGASGFLGPYVMNRLGKIGSSIVVPYRGDELYLRKLKPMADLGQINLYPMSIRKAEEIEQAVAGSNVVINLMGIHLETSRWKFDDVHVRFPSVLAEICAEQGVEKFVHVSALGASVDAPSKWGVSKAVGDELVKEAFPGATIVRPATMFGDADRYLNRIAKLSQSLPFMPLVDADKFKQQPVYADDVAAAIVEAIANPSLKGETLDLAGPKQYTNKDVVDYVLKIIDEPANSFNVPSSVGMAMAFGIQQLPDAWMSCDQLRRESEDIVRAEGTGFEELGITPTSIEDIGERYLIRFRKAGILQDYQAGKVIKQPSV